MNESEIDKLLILLQTTKAKKLLKVLKNSNVGGEKKIIFLLQNLITVRKSEEIYISPNI